MALPRLLPLEELSTEWLDQSMHCKASLLTTSEKKLLMAGGKPSEMFLQQAVYVLTSLSLDLLIICFNLALGQQGAGDLQWTAASARTLGMTAALISSRVSVVHSSRKVSTGLEGQPTEIYDMRARFFTSPHACPSGVSAGQIMPHCTQDLASANALLSWYDGSNTLMAAAWDNS